MEFPVYEDYDDYGDFPEYEDVADEQEKFELMDLPFPSLWTDCIMTIFRDTFPKLAAVLCMCFIFNVARMFLPELPHRTLLLNLFTATLGCVVLLWTFEKDFIILIIFTVTNYPVLWLATKSGYGKYRGPIVALYSVSFVVIYELCFADPLIVHKIRGVQMIFLMKIISVSLEHGSLIDLGEYLGYCFHVGTCVFGPWIPLKVYREITSGKADFSGFLHSLLRCSVSLILAVMCFVASTCLIPWIYVRGLGNWIRAYQAAAGFRFSHYFTCYFSEASLLAAGATDICVSKPFKIELPRSLTQVVVYWNIPMRDWLKTNVFMKVREAATVPIALGATYCASSLLHGINFQISAVLLSLSFFTYVEHSLRNKLAEIFDACIAARACCHCKHLHTSANFYVIVTNLTFAFVTVIQLAYLGMLFDDVNEQQKGYGYEHTLIMWQKLDFAGHYIAILFGSVQYLI